MKRKRVTDHEGRRFRNKNDMCRHWNISPDIYSKRLREGLSKKDALTLPVNTETEKSKVNSKGAWEYLIDKLDSDEKVPETPVVKTIPKKELKEGNKMNGQVTDHEGNIFPNTSQMCKHWGIVQGTFDGRIKRGMSVKEALTAPIKPILGGSFAGNKVTYNGITYSSTAKLCTDLDIMTHYSTVTRVIREANGNQSEIDKQITALINGKKPLKKTVKKKIGRKNINKHIVRPDTTPHPVESVKNDNPSVKAAIPYIEDAIKSLNTASGFLLGRIDNATLIRYSELIQHIDNVLKELSAI